MSSPSLQIPQTSPWSSQTSIEVWASEDGWTGRETFSMYPAIVLFCEMVVWCSQTDDRLLYVRARQDIYWVRRFGKIGRTGCWRRRWWWKLEWRFARSYIFVCANIRLPMKVAGLPLDALWPMVAAWCVGDLNNMHSFPNRSQSINILTSLKVDFKHHFTQACSLWRVYYAKV
jgi:hypothetical protein